MDQVSQQHILHYPMGPKTRTLLGISEDQYQGENSPLATELHREQFSKHIEERICSEECSDNDLTDLIDELIAMDLPDLVIAISDRKPQLRAHKDFRCQLSLGVAGMLTENYDFAEESLRAAQEILPAEPAPYINIVQILMAQSRLDEAVVWCESGLEAEPNNYALWELMTRIREITDETQFPELIMRLATHYNSWAGMALAASLSSTGDRYLKVNLLEKLYAQGERDQQFLIEYTAALGVAGDMEKIPPIIWLEETASNKPQLSWQLYLHAAQAYLSMDRFKECLQYVEKTESHKYMPDEAMAALIEIKTEAAEGIKNSLS